MMNRARTVLGIAGALALMAAPAFGQDCAWRPWAASWSRLNKGPDLYPPNLVYDPTNWDYSFSQSTLLNLPKDTPPGGGSLALHFFFDSQIGANYAYGSGGVYQEITVQAGVPIQYSFYWKGKAAGAVNWFEFLLIDGSFSPDAADMNAAGNIIRKRTASFAWQQLTDQSPPDSGFPATITPTGDTVAVVLKAGHTVEPGGSEVFFDSVEVRQNNGPNLLVNGDFEDTAQAPVCDSELMFQDGSQSDYWLALSQCPADQHTTVAPVSPASHDNNTDTTMTISGTWLENVGQVRLVPVDGGADIVATGITPGTGPNATTLTAVFPTTGATDGIYDVVTEQSPSPFCLTQILPAAFEVVCPTALAISSIAPTSLTDPGNSEGLTIYGNNVDRISGVGLEYMVGDPPAEVITAGSVIPDPAGTQAFFDLSCAPAGWYRLSATRSDACRSAVVENDFLLIESPPAEACAWLPWAASWSQLNIGDDIDPPNEVYNPTNWDYTLSQETLLNTPKDTPPGGGVSALHWFLDSQPPAVESLGTGSGGVYQEITVEPGVALQYSYYWKGAAGAGDSWFEFMLIDGPFSIGAADLFSESAAANNPSMIRKRELSDATFDWEQVTDQTAADEGPAGPRLQTIRPTGNTVTIVLKAGRYPAGAMESFWDNIVVQQNSGPNLVAEGDFENYVERMLCDDNSMFQDSCEENYWRFSPFVPLPPCPRPQVDADGDHDVDMEDFAAFQQCYTGSGGTATVDCRCFDMPEPLVGDGDIDQSDLVLFLRCGSGAGVEANPDCGDQMP